MQGQNWIKINSLSEQFSQLIQLLYEIESYIENKDARLKEIHYWALSPNYGDSMIATIDNKPIDPGIKIGYFDIIDIFKSLDKLMEELNLEPYIAKTKKSNWGIHRHIYSQTARWNLCFVGPNAKSAKVNFYGDLTGKDFEDGIFFNLTNLTEKDKPIETLDVEPNENYAFNTQMWHSHIAEDDHTTDCFLLHFKNSASRLDVLDSLKRTNLYDGI